MPVSLWQCLRILRTRRADLVIGVGGYTSPMMLLAAAVTGVARVILEPNANPGMANKAVGPFAQRVFLAFESAADSFNRSKVRVVGTPIRKAFLDGVQQSREKSGPPHLLIFGGSQGAKALNAAVMEGLPDLMTQLPHLTVTHQTGESTIAGGEPIVAPASSHKSCRFSMTCLRTAEADLVVARAGAMTVADSRRAESRPSSFRCRPPLRPPDAECQGDGSSRGRRGAPAIWLTGPCWSARWNHSQRSGAIAGDGRGQSIVAAN